MDRDSSPISLIEKAQKGDRSAFETLLSQHQARLEALIRSRMSRYRLANVDPADIT